jgi:hypothetical protein
VAETNCTVDGAAVAVTGGVFTVGDDGVHDVTCTATDDAGQTSAPAATTVKIDSSPPVIAYSGNAGTYSVDATVNIACDASDALSGIAATTCTAITGPAYGFATGQNTFSSSADDVAGNHATASTSFVVLVTAAGLSTLTINFVQDSAAYKALDPVRQAALDRQASALSGGLSSLAPRLGPAQRAALIRAYQARVAAAAGRGLLTSGQTATLQRLANAL